MLMFHRHTQWNIIDVMHSVVYNMAAAIEASLSALLLKTVCCGSRQICERVLVKRITRDYHKTLQVWLVTPNTNEV